MTKALLHELGGSLSFGRLSLRAKVLWPMLLASSDDQGRGTAEADAIKWHVCQNVDEITKGDVCELLKEMVDQHMIILYECDRGNTAYQVVRWWEFQELQWARPSKYGPPENWTDRIRYSNRGDYYQNDGWLTTGGFDAQPREKSKSESGRKQTSEPGSQPPSEPGRTETSDQVENQPNPTEPNSTQPNLTQPDLTQADLVQADPEPIKTGVSTPSPSSIAFTPQQLGKYLKTPTKELADNWPTFVQDISASMTREAASQWIEPLRPVCIRDHTVVLAHPTTYGVDWCTGKLKKPFEREWSALLGKPITVVMQLAPGGT